MRGVWRAATRAAYMVGGGGVEISAWSGVGRLRAMTALRCGVSESSSSGMALACLCALHSSGERAPCDVVAASSAGQSRCASPSSNNML